MDKENLVYIHNEVYSAIKKNEMSFVEKWMELEIFVLRKISQTQKDKHHIFSHMQNLDLKKMTRMLKGDSLGR
jgi:hypothetical protein